MALFLKKTDWGEYPANVLLEKGKLVQQAFRRLSDMGISLAGHAIVDLPEHFQDEHDSGKANKTGFYILTDI